MIGCCLPEHCSDLQAHVVADALKQVPEMLHHSPNIKTAFEVFVSFLELVRGKEADTCKLPYPVMLAFMSMEALPAIRVVGGGVTDHVRPRPSPDGSCIMTRIIRSAPSAQHLQSVTAIRCQACWRCARSPLGSRCCRRVWRLCFRSWNCQ